MFNRCTYSYIGHKTSTIRRSHQLFKSENNLVQLTQHYTSKRISPYGISVSFPMSIRGFSLLHTPNDAHSFGVIKIYHHPDTH
jgi:hypothetical protein